MLVWLLRCDHLRDRLLSYWRDGSWLPLSARKVVLKFLEQRLVLCVRSPQASLCSPYRTMCLLAVVCRIGTGNFHAYVLYS